MIQIIRLEGLSPYEATVAEMRERVARVVAGDDAAQAIYFLEHPPTVTRGRGLQLTGEDRPRQMPLDLAGLPPGTGYFEIERGGDLTAHEPGQLVIYPVVRIQDHDLGNFLRGFEKAVIRALSGLGVEAASQPNAAGVWFGDRKIASMGIAVKSWVTSHGLALNCTNSLELFHRIQPCGYAPDTMTRLCDLIPDQFASWGAEWRREVEDRVITELVTCLG